MIIKEILDDIWMILFFFTISCVPIICVIMQIITYKQIKKINKNLEMINENLSDDQVTNIINNDK